MNLQETCKTIQHQNPSLTYASVIDLDHIPELEQKNVWCKPDAVFFSLITDGVPEWYTWVTWEDFKVETYAKRGLLFASFHDEKLVTQKTAEQSYTERRYGADFIDWQAIQAQGFSGIVVDSPCGPLWGGWDVSTVAVWSPEAISLVQAVPNAGKEWAYDL